MENKTIKQKVEKILESYPKARNSDRFLQYKYWTVIDNIYTLDDWLQRATDAETIRRSRQLIQNEREDLRATQEVQEERFQKQFEFLNFVK